MPDAPSHTALSDRPAQARAGGELFSEERSAEVVGASFAGTPDPRLRQVMTSLVQHLHAFVKDVELTEEEWGAAIDFLTRTGQHERRGAAGVHPAVRRPRRLDAGGDDQSPHRRHVDRVDGARARSTWWSPRRGSWATNIALDGKGEPCLVSGRVTGPDGEPLAGASVDVWQTNEDGFYDVQQPGIQPGGNLRGLFTADGDGRFWFRSVVPRFYPIPDDGPVGRAAGGDRAAPEPAGAPALHRRCPGLSAGDHPRVRRRQPLLDSDAVFGVKESLIRDVPGGRRPGPGRGGRAAQPVPHACTSTVAAARGPGAAGRSAGGRAADRRAGSAVVIRAFTYQALPMRVVFGAGSLARLPDEVDGARADPGAGAVLSRAGGHRPGGRRRTGRAGGRRAARGPDARADRGRPTGPASVRRSWAPTAAWPWAAGRRSGWARRSRSSTSCR